MMSPLFGRYFPFVLDIIFSTKKKLVYETFWVGYRLEQIPQKKYCIVQRRTPEGSSYSTVLKK
jgi:hypothetical protein